ncbi:hypothetical protein LCGC14_1834810 [marine sediment metagenome]|uniref:Uncharacterized protein n=1 Tax=marine sediment metagenome TaxID=412755 RepID=A0A0F9H373_9ZZZZ
MVTESDKTWECPECGTTMIVSDKAGIEALETFKRDARRAALIEVGEFVAAALAEKERPDGA